MFVKVGDEKVQYVKPKVILQLNTLFNIIGYSNNSVFYKIHLVSEDNTPILCMGYDWTEYLQMIKYAKEAVKI